MSRFKRIAAILVAVSMISVSMVACSKPTSTSSSSETSSSVSEESSSVASEDTSSTGSDTSSVSSDTASGTTSTVSRASGTTSTKTTSIVSNKTTTSSKKTASTKTSSTTYINTAKPSNSTSGLVKNMSGRTVIFNTPNDVDNGPKDKHIERMKAKIASAEKQYNCKINIQYSDNAQYSQKKISNSIIAGKPIVDLWSTQYISDWLPAYVAGLIQPLDALKCFNFSDKAKYSNAFTDPMVVNGVHYGLSISNNGLASPFQWDQMMFYRYDVLQKSGVTANMMPDALVKSGNWTWDNFAKVCQKIRAAGNIPLTDVPDNAGGQQVNLYQEMCYTFGSDYIIQDSAKKTTFNGGSAASLKALNLYCSFVSNKIIDAPDAQKAVWNAIIAQDNVAFQPGLLCMAKWLYPRWGTEVCKANWGMTYLPKVNASDSYTVMTYQLAGGECMPYGVKNPADAATVLQAICPIDTDYTAGKAETMMDYELWLPSNQTMANSVLDIENQVNDLAYKSGQRYEVTEMAQGPGVCKDWLTHVQKIATGQEDAASAIKANTDKYNEKLKSLYVIR